MIVNSYFTIWTLFPNNCEFMSSIQTFFFSRNLFSYIAIDNSQLRDKSAKYKLKKVKTARFKLTVARKKIKNKKISKVSFETLEHVNEIF